MANTGGRRNRHEVRGAQDVMNMLKMEVATELGIPNYEQLDKGNLPARLHGKVGGLMVRKMIEFAETAMKTNPQFAQEVMAMRGANEQDIQVAQQNLQQAAAFETALANGQMAQQITAMQPPVQVDGQSQLQ